jgi:non-ribosomal peptide synthetase component F
VTIRECTREADLLAAIGTGRWPETCDAELRAHVAGCTTCGDVAALATALRAERAEAWQHAVVPGSGLVWWRAELRARQERAARIERPITLVHVLAIVVCLAAAIAGAVVAAPLVPALSWFSSLGDWLPSFTLGGADAVPLLWPVILVALGAWLLLAPIVIYFVVARD